MVEYGNYVVFVVLYNIIIPYSKDLSQFICRNSSLERPKSGAEGGAPSRDMLAADVEGSGRATHLGDRGPAKVSRWTDYRSPAGMVITDFVDDYIHFVSDVEGSGRATHLGDSK